MTVFPVTASTLSAKDLGVLVKDMYGLSENYTCKLFRTGINHTYFLSDDRTKYVLRMYSFGWRTQSEILEEINLLNLLKNKNLGISYPIPDKNGDFIQNIHAPEGLRYGVLFSFADGNKMRFMDEATCLSVGSFMAKIHSITINKKIDRTNYDLETLLERPYQSAKSHFSESLKEMEYIKKTSKEIRNSFTQIDLATIKTGIVHMDIWYDNMSVTDTNEITLFDFDFCGNGWFILDIAYFCKQLFHIESDKNMYERKVQSFIVGYKNIRNFSDEELKLIPSSGAAIWIFYLGIQSQRFDWSNIFLSENYLKMYVGKMKSWLDYYHSKKLE